MSDIGVKRVDHVSMAVWSIDQQAAFLERVFGVKRLSGGVSEAQEYRWETFAIPNSTLQFELIEPTSEDSFVAKFLRERGPGIHHVTIEVEDIERAADALRTNGIEPFPNVHYDGWRQTFIHPKDSGGVLFQLFTAAPAPPE